MQDVEKKRKTIINVIYFAMLAVLAFFIVRYALGVCFPFVFAFLVAVILQRPKNFLVRKTFLKNGPASVICVFLLLIILCALVALIGVRAIAKVQEFINYIVAQFKDSESIVNNIQAWLMTVIAKLPEFLRKTLSESVTELFGKLREYVGQDTQALADAVASSGLAAGDTAAAAAEAANTASAAGGMSGLLSKFQISWITTPLSSLISTAKQIPSILISVVITLVACCFMTTDYDKVMYFFRCQFPEHRREDVDRAKTLLKTSLGKMGKAYALIMLVTFVEVSAGLTVLRLIGVFESSYIVMIAIATAIIDIVPVLGTGTVLIPWALYSIITGNFGMGIGLVIMYIIITVIRQVIEPKLVAGQLGLSPIVTIAALYLGLKLFGVLGMFVTPLIIIMLKLLNDEGIIHLWKSPTRIRAQKAAAEAAAASDAPEDTGENAAEDDTNKTEPTA